MIREIMNKLFGKEKEENAPALPINANATFVLRIDNLHIGYLSCKEGIWNYKYSEEFKNNEEYNAIVGFPDLNKIYESESLWPFFKIRIPGLKQPVVQETLKDENIDVNNEFELLKRFGAKTISNPYELLLL